MLGRGDDRRVQVMERRLEETRAELAGVSGAVLEARRAAQAAVWQARLGDVLEEYPDLAAGLRELVTQIRRPCRPVRSSRRGTRSRRAGM